MQGALELRADQVDEEAEEVRKMFKKKFAIAFLSFLLAGPICVILAFLTMNVIIAAIPIVWALSLAVLFATFPFQKEEKVDQDAH